MNSKPLMLTWPTPPAATTGSTRVGMGLGWVQSGRFNHYKGHICSSELDPFINQVWNLELSSTQKLERSIWILKLTSQVWIGFGSSFNGLLASISNLNSKTDPKENDRVNPNPELVAYNPQFFSAINDHTTHITGTRCSSSIWRAVLSK